MPVGALAVLAALGVVRAAYPRVVEWRAGRRRPLGGDGIVVGATPFRLDRRGATAVLLLHGAGDTPQVVADLARHLHANGFAVRVPLLAGHGRTVRALRHVRAAEWHAEVEREFDALLETYPRACIVGLSMGGAIAISLAARRSDVCALVLLAPYIAMPSAVRWLARSARWWGILLPYFPSASRHSIRDTGAARRTLGQGILTPGALRALSKVVDTASIDLANVRAPTLVMQSTEDNRIARAATERAFTFLGASTKQLRWLEGAGHVITVDYGHERVFEATADWLTVHCPVRKTKGGESP